MKLPIARLRAEKFGGIVQLVKPKALLHVDRAMMRKLGHADSPLWDGPEGEVSVLSAPTEVHVVLSRRCAAGCTGCYVDATPTGAALSYDDACSILSELAAMGVFHVALGGGEAIDLDYLFAVAEHATRVGIVPNLTTSGLGLTPALAERCKVFGQINVSVDGVGDGYRAARGFDGFRHAERALELLRGVKREVGINCVVSRSSFDGLREVARLAKRLKLNELELLRFKPVGRGMQHTGEELSEDQSRRIYPLALRMAARFFLRVKLDCSFAPMVFWHKPSKAAAAFFGVQGCVAGDVLAAVMPEGHMTGCSFCGPPEADARQPGSLRAAWDAGFRDFRDWPKRAPEPCASCDYLSLCRGGCRAVALAHGGMDALDPGCPRVQEHWKSTRPKTASRLPVVQA